MCIFDGQSASRIQISKCISNARSEDRRGRRWRNRAGVGFRLRYDFNGADLGILNLGSECDLDLAVSHIDRNRLNIGLHSPSRLHPYVEVVELLALDVEGKHSFSRPSDAIERLGKMQLHQILPIGHRPRKRIHAVVLGSVEIRTLRSWQSGCRAFQWSGPLQIPASASHTLPSASFTDSALPALIRIIFAPDARGGRSGCHLLGLQPRSEWLPSLRDDPETAAEQNDYKLRRQDNHS